MVREALTRQKLNALRPAEAAAVLVARRAEGLTADEERLLAEWLAADEAHWRSFASTERAWGAFADAEGHEIVDALRAHARAARPHARPAWRLLAAAAAVAIIAIGTAVFVNALRTPAPPSSQQAAAPVITAEYVSARGEIREIELADGTRMTLDADSAAVARFTDVGRTVALQRGRAYFDVVPNAAKPFAVEAGRRTVFAVGTRFDVNLSATGLTVTLLEGRVEVTPADPARARLTLTPGQQYVERLGNGTVRPADEGGENAIGWRTGQIFLDDQTLSEAADVMNRYSQDQIVVPDPLIASLRVSGQFRAGDVDRFASTVAELHMLETVRRPGVIELVR